jgi:hypothetical protein
MKLILVTVLATVILAACSPTAVEQPLKKPDAVLAVYGKWITEPDGTVMLDPQTSGLVNWRNKLMTLSDRSALEVHRLRLRTINPDSATMPDNGIKLQLSDTLTSHCFAGYVSRNPDLESLVVDPADDNILYMVTEDATYDDELSAQCQQTYHHSSSTQFPFLLVRLELQDQNTALITHIRPLKFTEQMQIGDTPNDGIEAMAFGQNRTLYLGLERDTHKQARVFSITISPDFWQSEDFAAVQDAQLKLPKFTKGNHPINGMDYYQTPQGKEYLIAAARNDSKLWLIDLTGQKETRIISLEFYAQLSTSTDNCRDAEIMDNASIEGVAVIGQTVWMINDPWKEAYPKNILCLQNKTNYENYSPLLFSLAIQPSWFE